MDLDDFSLWLQQVSMALLIGLVLIEIIDRFLAPRNEFLERTKNYERATVVLLGLAIVELTERLEIKYLVMYNENVSFRIVGVEEYTLYFMLIVATIEETLKFIVIAILVKKGGHRKIYLSVGVTGAFAGMEHLYHFITYGSRTTDEAIRRAFVGGTQNVHIGIGFFIMSVLMLVNNYQPKENTILYTFFKYNVYILTWLSAIAMHTYYNYVSTLSLFDIYDDEYHKQLSWSVSILFFLIWTIIVTRIKPTDKIKTKPNY